MELQRWNVAFLLMTVRFLHMKAANILGVFPVGAKSHFAFNESIMKSLHAAGHEITIICPVFKGTQTIKNFTVISIPFGSLDSTTRVTEMRGRFGENFKHIPEKKVSLVFQNIHSSLLARPLVENVIEVGGIRVKPINTLPLDIQKFIDESTGGVVLFTFGSIARGTFLSPSSVNAFKQVFAQIPQRVIWKYEDIIEDLPKNVMISDWIPQRHILAHENVVAFITHCGLSGIYEAIHSSVPLVMIPFYGDQLPNAAALEGLGVGVHLDPLTLSKETIRDALDSIVNDTSYRENMRNLSRRFKDRPMTPQESVVYWTEHVISHNGAPHLRTNLSDMPMYQYLCLDIFLVSSALLLIILLFVRQLERVYLEQSVPQSGKKKRN